MKPNIFVKSYEALMKSKNNIEAKDVYELVSKLIKPKKYLTFDDKLKIIDITINQVKNSKHFTAEIYRNFTINLVSAYTNLECQPKDFDLLCETRLLDVILSIFEDEYQRCNALM